MPVQDHDDVPARLRPRVQEIDALIDAFALEHLDAEYAALGRRMAAALAWRRPSPLERGEARRWAAGIIHAVGWVNFLTDPSQEPHMTAAELAAAAGVGQSTVAASFRTIRDALDLMRLDPEWTRPSKLADNPLAWMIDVDGLLMDVRDAPPEIQAEALRQGLIPFIPAAGAPGTGAPGADAERALRQAWTMLEDVLEQTLAAKPDATIDELNAELAAASAGYNRRPQAELGGLSPSDVDRLLNADWEGAPSAIRLDATLPADELQPSPTLDDARLVLTLLAELGHAKATPKGNFPRAFVAGFHERMRPRHTARAEWGEASKVLNEEDLFFSLHLARILLELSGLIKRRKGIISRTRRGEQLTGADHAGALFATLVRSHFRRLNLAYLDGADPAPGLQQTIGFTLYQFGRVGADWKTAAELGGALVLPAVSEALPTSPYFDERALLLETRFLRPLEEFGLARSREAPPQPGELLAHHSWRKTPLFDRFLTFDLASGG